MRWKDYKMNGRTILPCITASYWLCETEDVSKICVLFVMAFQREPLEPISSITCDIQNKSDFDAAREFG